jgi:hypothetical protein
LLSPVFAFLMALVGEILIGLLKDGGALALLALVAAGAIGGFLFRKLRIRPQNNAAAHSIATQRDERRLAD